MSGELHPRGTPPGVPALPPLVSPAQAAVLLDQVIYERVLDCVDVDALVQLEHMLALQIEELDGVDDERAGALARAIVERAVLRLPDDLVRFLRVAAVLSVDCEICEDEARSRCRDTVARQRGA